ncbi:MAG: hypothetical protein H8E12_07970 [Rhodobacteraceae bacterium]|nr:hypothetical protein [Paracoccaceae bacterium]
MNNESNIKPEDIISSNNTDFQALEKLTNQMSDIEERVNSLERLIMQVLDKIESGAPVF